MKIASTRLGTIQVTESDLVRMPDGLIGFRGETEFARWPDPEVVGLTWWQSVRSSEIAFALVPPPMAVGDYKVEIRSGDLAALELDDERSALIYVILNRAEGGGLTANLQGPLVLNAARRIARQLVLTSSRFAVRYPIAAASPAVLPGPSSYRATA